MEKSFVLQVRVTPRAGRDEITGWRESVLEVRVKAPPVEGEANAALVRVLAAALGVRRSQVELVSGHAGRTKRVRVQGLDEAEVRRRFGA